MKKYPIIIVLVFLMLKLQAQDYLISFAGEGEVYTVDSVKVENLNLGTVLTLNGTDILFLSPTVGISTFSENTNEPLLIYPDPVIQDGFFEFDATIQGFAKIEIYGMKMNLLIQNQYMLSKGRHKFQLNGLPCGIYILSIKSEAYFYSGKLISQASSASTLKIDLLSSNHSNLNPQKRLKVAKSMVPMLYHEGEQLILTFYSSIYKSVVSHVATKDTTLSAIFINCTDANSYSYPTVTLYSKLRRDTSTYSQIWMAQNLNVGTMIDTYQQQMNNGILEKYCFNNDITYCDQYGGYYQWDELMAYVDSARARGICPLGWHLPTVDEWCNLAKLIDPTVNCNGSQWGTDVGIKMKSNSDWGCGESSNSSGFSALGSGVRDMGGTFQNLLVETYFASSELADSTIVFHTLLWCDENTLDLGITHKDYAFNVRCVQDGPHPTVTTQDVTNLTETSAITGGNVVFEGGDTVSARGVCWSTSSLPTISDSITLNGSGTGLFTSSLSGLSEYTLYYLRAYSVNIYGTGYGKEITFETYSSTPSIPTLTTSPISDTTHVSGMTGGNVVTHGGAPVTARGVCWSVSPSPTIADNLTIDGSGSGVFESNIVGLIPNTTYYVRAYATNSVGTAYGNEVVFSTLPSPSEPSVITSPVTEILLTTATCGGNVTYWGGAPVTARGVCWSTSPAPTIVDSRTIDASGTGEYISYITGLSDSTTYYVRAYATNAYGTGYGSELFFVPLPDSFSCPGSPGIFYEGKMYNTVLIGTQCWLRESLNFGTRVNIGEYQTNNGIVEKHCYLNLESNCDIYGATYQWYEAMQYVENEGAQGICPNGWHIPTDAEWCTMLDVVDPQTNCNPFSGGVDAGLKLKSNNGWYYPGNGTNEFGFDAHPSGDRLMGFYWTSTMYDTYDAWNRHFWFENSVAGRSLDQKTTGDYVRCLKN